MDYITLVIRNEEYKLRLTTRGCIQLEKALGCNPLQLFWELDNGKLPKLTDMIILLHSMLQAYHHGLTVDKVYDLFDDYVADGHNMFDLVPVFMDVFKASGFVSVSEEEPKNA